MRYYLLVVLFALSAGCTVKKEYVLNEEGVPEGAGKVVVEGPGGDMVAVTVDVLEKIAPILPEPWNSIAIALLAGFSATTATWVFRSRKEKKNA